MQRLLNVPSKPNDVATVLQAISKLIVDKLNPITVQTALDEKNKVNNPKDPGSSVQLLMDSINTGLETNGSFVIKNKLFFKD